MWQRYLRNTARRISSNITPDQIEALGNGFRSYVRSFSTNGSYDTSSCTPHAFLIFAFQSFYVHTEAYRDIISNKSMILDRVPTVFSAGYMYRSEYDLIDEDSNLLYLPEKLRDRYKETIPILLLRNEV